MKHKKEEALNRRFILLITGVPKLLGYENLNNLNKYQPMGTDF